MVGLGGFIGAIIIGGFAGWVASMIMKTDASMGLFANIIVGVLGAVIGNAILTLVNIDGTNGFNVWSFLVALLGAVVLLSVLRLFRGK